MGIKSEKSQINVRAWEGEGLLLEKYTYTSGSVEPLQKHTHNEYQFGLSFDCQGEYYYRGTFHQIPTGNLSIIHSGEVHSPSQRCYLPSSATFWMMHVDPNLLQTAASEMAERAIQPPFFSVSFVGDRSLVNLFLELHIAIEKQTSQLQRDSAFLDFFTHAIAHSARSRPSVRPIRSIPLAIFRVRDFLQDNYASEISLQELADLTGFSRFYLARAFCKQFGVSPHFYQLQVRIARAKRLLVQGIPIATVACMTGFYDQSHFTRYFKQLVGVTPGNYLAEGNNFLDRLD